MSKKNTKEQQYIDALEVQVTHLYDKIERNIPYKSYRSCGELDFIGYKGEYMDIYEVKCSSKRLQNILKAEKQLDRARQHFAGVRNCFIYLGKEDKIIKYTPNKD